MLIVQRVHAASFLFGSKGINLLFETMMLYRHSNELESGHFLSNTADMVWGLLCVGAGIIGLNYPFGTPVFFQPFLIALTYLVSRPSPLLVSLC